MQQRAALGEERNIESNREPVHDGAELPECRGGITCFVGKPDKVSRSMQLEQACSLFARPDDGPLKAKPSLVVIALRLPEAAAQPRLISARCIFSSVVSARCSASLRFARASSSWFARS